MRYKPDSKVDQITTRAHSFQTLEPVVTIHSRPLKCYNLNMFLPSGLPKPFDPVFLGRGGSNTHHPILPVFSPSSIVCFSHSGIRGRVLELRASSPWRPLSVGLWPPAPMRSRSSGRNHSQAGSVSNRDSVLGLFLAPAQAPQAPTQQHAGGRDTEADWW